MHTHAVPPLGHHHVGRFVTLDPNLYLIAAGFELAAADRHEMEPRSRTVRWRVELGQLPRIRAHAAEDVSASRHAGVDDNEGLEPWRRMLDQQRAEYVRRKDELLRAPDGSRPEGVGLQRRASPSSSMQTADRAVTRIASSAGSEASLSVNNPLSLADANPWHAHFAMLGVLQQIRIDVERAFAGEERFERAKDQHLQQQRQRKEVDGTSFDEQLTAILAVWSMLPQHAAVGYRQGMHELAALCWLVVLEDCNGAGLSDLSTPQNIHQHQHLEADTYSLFDVIMARAEPWFAWKVSGQVSLASISLLRLAC